MSQLNFDVLKPQPTHHIFLSGMNGCGKTVLAQKLLETRKDNLRLVFDAKDELDWKGYTRFTRISKLISANPRHAIYAPNIYELNNPDCWDYFLKFGFLRQRKNYRRKNKLQTTIYVDEVYAITEKEQLPFHYKAGLTRGRKIELELWSATQRPKNIPQFLMSESKHQYIFYHQMFQDKVKLVQTFGIEMDLLDSLSFENHEFIYANLNRISGKLRLKGLT